MLSFVMRHVLAAGLAAATATLPSGHATAQATSAHQIIGVWEAMDGGIKLEIFDAGGSYAARMLYGRLLVEADGKTFKKDTLNPDPALRGRSLERAVVMTDLAWDERDRRWEGGNFYSGATGRTVSAQAELVGDTMEVRAYVGAPLLGQTIVFRRVP
ncbi:DUF2147 domain-containing protein [Ancylobacter sp. A5.8]|uniref:DUF2147 domain-containing protein n=1 Tax=Ancylobacter gelatini TaxID=2919920 RepID=UPI001F4D6085|nr:DUF2147 domain-containing protein [Ancylobacter gelatini]MCJ8142196.1 DUF2147 domain-containing protein [Ancylobacter gelatini]